MQAFFHRFSPLYNFMTPADSYQPIVCKIKIDKELPIPPIISQGGHEPERLLDKFLTERRIVETAE